jgi:hypothetical protein
MPARKTSASRVANVQQPFGYRTPAGVFNADEKDLHVSERRWNKFYKFRSTSSKRTEQSVGWDAPPVAP